MRLAGSIVGIFAVWLCSFAAGPRNVPAETSANTTPSPLILEKPEGERRVRRFSGNKMGTTPFILKVDPKNGASQHSVLFTEDLAPGASIPRHKHPGAEEIVILQTGTSRVHLGDIVKDVGAGATVFIPPGTWISVDNIGREPVSLIAIFSEPGYEEYMRAISVREGEDNSPLSKDELNAIRKQHPHSVIYE
jgi:quercetin dioxygenase-like cupin family protein